MLISTGTADFKCYFQKAYSGIKKLFVNIHNEDKAVEKIKKPSDHDGFVI